MLKFIDARAMEREGVSLDSVKTKPSDANRLGFLTTLVIERFLEQVQWDDIVQMYLTGLASDEDIAIVQRAVAGLVDGGIEYGV